MITATEPIAPLDAFTGSLATAQNPSFLAPLGHVVDPDGPSGQVEGLAGPIVPQVKSSGPELPVATHVPSAAKVVQRVLAPWIRPTEPAASVAAPAPC